MAQQTDLFEFKDENARFGIKDEWMNKPLHIGGQKQQTAVEWFEQNISKYIHYQYDEAYEQHQLVTLIFEQAKQMEKEQIMTAYDKVSMSTPEQYYNETYGENKD